jgi:hypothetical protein
MREGIEQKGSERAADLDAAERSAQETGDVEAQASLAAMREELVRTGGIKAVPDGDAD